MLIIFLLLVKLTQMKSQLLFLVITEQQLIKKVMRIELEIRGSSARVLFSEGKLARAS